MITVNHGGDLGDLVYFLPTAKWLAEHHGEPIVLEIQPLRITRQRLTPDVYAPLVPLLESQDYIREVRPWSGEPCTYNGNTWRMTALRALHESRGQRETSPAARVPLAEWQRRQLGAPPRCLEQPWLDIAPPPNGSPAIVFNRSLRYHGPKDFPWARFVEAHRHESCFIGLQEEHLAFVEAFGEVPYLPTADLLEAARVIRGSRLFIGNQSCCFAICEGMKHPAVLEVWRSYPNCCIERDNVVHGVGAHAFEDSQELR